MTDVTIERETLQAALERMDRARAILTDNNPRPECNWGMLDTSDLRAALAAQPHGFDRTASHSVGEYVDTAQPAPAAVPLTDEQIDELWAECMDRYPSTTTIINLARAIERAHGIAAAGDKPTPTPQQESALQKIADFGQEQERGPVRETVSRVVKGIIRNDKP